MKREKLKSIEKRLKKSGQAKGKNPTNPFDKNARNNEPHGCRNDN